MFLEQEGYFTITMEINKKLKNKNKNLEFFFGEFSKLGLIKSSKGSIGECLKHMRWIKNHSLKACYFTTMKHHL